MKNENYGQSSTAHLVGCYVCVCCVLCFVLSPKQSGVLKCLLSQYQKMKIMSYVFRRVSSLRPEKKVPVICLAKKKRYSRLSVGCVVLAITTGKKKFQSSVWRVVLLWFWRLRPEKKKFQSSFWQVVSFWFWRLRPEKKVPVVIKFVLVKLELKLIQIRQFNFNISVTYKVDTYNFV